MTIARRDFLRASTLGIAGGLLATTPFDAAASGPGEGGPAARVENPRIGLPGANDDWDEIRARFAIDRSWIHMSGLFLTSHPEPVARAIAEYRQALDANPTHEVTSRWGQDGSTRGVIAEYIGGDAADIGLTGSTTMGLAIAVHGLRLDPGAELLQTTHDHSVSNRAIEYKAEHAGASVRQISLYDNARPELVDRAEVLERLAAALRPETRVFLATWVHSRNGVKLPIADMSAVIDEANRNRDPSDRIVFVVDGVHGFGIEDQPIPELGCDFFSAGTHKWIFAPRGTGMLWGNPRAQDRVTPVIPSIGGGGGWGGSMSPGGFHAFEHRWAVARAFEFHMAIGKRPIQERIHELNGALKEGLAGMSHVRLYTPMDRALSSGLVCFDVDGMSAGQVVDRLRDEHRIVASTTPYSPSFARFTAGLLNDHADVEATLEAVRGLG